MLAVNAHLTLRFQYSLAIIIYMHGYRLRLWHPASLYRLLLTTRDGGNAIGLSGTILAL